MNFRQSKTNIWSSMWVTTYLWKSSYPSLNYKKKTLWEGNMIRNDCGSIKIFHIMLHWLPHIKNSPLDHPVRVSLIYQLSYFHRWNTLSESRKDIKYFTISKFVLSPNLTIINTNWQRRPLPQNQQKVRVWAVPLPLTKPS